MPALLEKLWLVLFPAVERPIGDRSSYERFAIPFTFKPQLSFWEAVVAAAGAFVRILLGCLLFAMWGTYTLFAWSTIHNLFLRVAAIAALLVAFLFSLLVLLVTISFLTRAIRPNATSL